MKRFKDIAVKMLMTIITLVCITSPAFASFDEKDGTLTLTGTFGPVYSESHQYLVSAEESVSIGYCSSCRGYTPYQDVSFSYSSYAPVQHILKLGTDSIYLNASDWYNYCTTTQTKSATVNGAHSANTSSRSATCNGCRNYMAIGYYFTDGKSSAPQYSRTYNYTYWPLDKVAQKLVLKNCTTQKWTMQPNRAVEINGGNYQGSPAINSGNVTVIKGTLTDNFGNSTFIVGPDSIDEASTSGNKTVHTVKLINPPIIIDWADFPGWE